MNGCEIRDSECCDDCEVIPVFGVVPASNPWYSGGHVDKDNVRHDPVRHENHCRRARAE